MQTVYVLHETPAQDFPRQDKKERGADASKSFEGVKWRQQGLQDVNWIKLQRIC